MVNQNKVENKNWVLNQNKVVNQNRVIKQRSNRPQLQFALFGGARLLPFGQKNTYVSFLGGRGEGAHAISHLGFWTNLLDLPNMFTQTIRSGHSNG